MEMNTRIQVEHPVTEMITGVDLVAEMIKVAFGAPLAFQQDDIGRTGHAIEVRVNAEDPSRNFMPFPGITGAISVPERARFDSMLYEGYAIPPFYDSLLGKLIVHGASRAEALENLRAALRDIRIEGLKTTLPLFQALANEPDVIADAVNTAWLESWLDRNTIEAA
jgi:acetyl-CoA carboxylase biotin carboxylase subunit